MVALRLGVADFTALDEAGDSAKLDRDCLIGEYVGGGLVCLNDSADGLLDALVAHGLEQCSRPR